jgi:DNA-binding transcriptional regulator of glucitol operon
MTTILMTGPGIALVCIVVTALLVYEATRSSNKSMAAKEMILEQGIEQVREIQGMSQTELKSLVIELHEQNRIAREGQERAHRREIRMAQEPTFLIVIVVAFALLLAWIVFHAHKEMNSMAITTIRNAISLTPQNILKDFLSAQNELSATESRKVSHRENTQLESKKRNRKRLR